MGVSLALMEATSLCEEGAGNIEGNCFALSLPELLVILVLG